MSGFGVICAWCGKPQWDREAAMRHGPACSRSPGYALRQAVAALQAHPCMQRSHGDGLVCLASLRDAIRALPLAPAPTDPSLAVAE